MKRNATTAGELVAPGLYCIVDLDRHVRAGRGAVDFLRQVLRGGCAAVQLRSKETPDAHVAAVARSLRLVTARARVPFIVDDRPDIAALCGADGVHLGQDDLPAAAVARAFPGLAIGLSTHDLRQVRRAGAAPVRYIGFGPVFATASKAGPSPTTGLDALERAAALSRVPVVAIGGIDERACAGLVARGVRRAAVISALWESGDPARTARAIHRALAG